MALMKEARELLEYLRGGHTLEEAAGRMGISMVRARILVSYLASRGLLEEAPSGCGECGVCPLGPSCSLARGARRVYLVRG